MGDPMGESAREVGFCVDLEPRRRVVTRKTIIPAAPTPSLEEYLASQPTADELAEELIAEAARVTAEWERELAALLRPGP